MGASPLRVAGPPTPTLARATPRPAQLRAARPDRAQALVQPSPRPRLDLAVAHLRLVPRRFQVLEPGVGLLDHEQLLGLALARHRGNLPLADRPDARTRTGRHRASAAGEERAGARDARDRCAALEVAHRRLAECARARVGDSALQRPADDGDELDRRRATLRKPSPDADHGEHLGQRAPCRSRSRRRRRSAGRGAPGSTSARAGRRRGRKKATPDEAFWRENLRISSSQTARRSTGSRAASGVPASPSARASRSAISSTGMLGRRCRRGRCSRRGRTGCEPGSVGPATTTTIGIRACAASFSTRSSSLSGSTRDDVDERRGALDRALLARPTRPRPASAPAPARETSSRAPETTSGSSALRRGAQLLEDAEDRAWLHRQLRPRLTRAPSRPRPRPRA